MSEDFLEDYKIPDLKEAITLIRKEGNCNSSRLRCSSCPIFHILLKGKKECFSNNVLVLMKKALFQRFLDMLGTRDE